MAVELVKFLDQIIALSLSSSHSVTEVGALIKIPAD